MYRIIKILIIVIISLGFQEVHSQQQVIFRLQPADVETCIGESAKFEAITDTLYIPGNEINIKWQLKEPGSTEWTDAPTTYPFLIQTEPYSEELKGIMTVLTISDLDNTYADYVFRCTVNELVSSNEARLTIHSLPGISFNASDLCYGDITRFTNTSPDSMNIASWEWDFGDGQVSSLFHAGHYYQQQGDYTVNLTGRDFNNCVNTQSAEITILELPSPEITMAKNVFCLNESNVLFYCEQDFESFSWEIETAADPLNGNNSSLLFNCDEGVFEPGQYTAHLTVGDSNGCYRKVTEPFLVLTSRVPKEGLVYQKENNSNLLVLLIEEDELFEYFWFAYNINNINDTIENNLVDKPYHLFEQDINTETYQYGVEVRSKNSECSTIFLFEK